MLQCLLNLCLVAADYPEGASQFCIRKLGGQFEVLKADSLAGPLVPGEQHGQLEGGHLKVVLAHLVFEGYLWDKNNFWLYTTKCVMIAP